MFLIAGLVAGRTAPAGAFLDDKFEKEVEKETGGKTMEDYQKLLGDNKEKPIVIYCGFVKCTRGHNGAAWAVMLGYENVFAIPAGSLPRKGRIFPLKRRSRPSGGFY